MIATLLCAAPQAAQDPWQVRILPKIYWGVHPVGLDGMAPTEPRVGVLHHFLGSWKVRHHGRLTSIAWESCTATAHACSSTECQ